MALIAFFTAMLIVLPLAFYAGRLLYQLKRQTQLQQQTRQKRIEHMVESIQTIALAMHQQQCNLSEGAIRLVHLLESLPVTPQPDCQQSYPALYELFSQVRELPTHADRKALSAAQRDSQDAIREEQEARLEAAILKEVAALKHFAPPV